MKRSKVLFSIIIFFCLILTYLLYFSGQIFVSNVDFLLQNFGIQMGIWELKHLVFALSISSLPLYALLAIKISKEKRFLSLLKYIVISLLAFLITIMIVFGYFYFKSAHTNENTNIHLKLNSIHFWNFAFIAANINSFIVTLFSARISNKKLNSSPELIDNEK